MNTLLGIYSVSTLLHFIPSVFVCHRFTSGNLGLGPSKQINLDRLCTKRLILTNQSFNTIYLVGKYFQFPSIENKKSECFDKSSCFNKPSKFIGLKQSEYLTAHAVETLYLHLVSCAFVVSSWMHVRGFVLLSGGVKVMFYSFASPHRVSFGFLCHPFHAQHSSLTTAANEVRVHKTIAFGIHLL